MIVPSSSMKRSQSLVIALILFALLAAAALYWSVVADRNYQILGALILSYLATWGAIFFLSTASADENARRFLLTSVSVGVTVAVLEFVVVTKLGDFRTILGTPTTEPWQHPGNLLDPQLLHIHKPYDHWLWLGTDYKYDGRGLRNQTDLDQADIVVIGDSFVEGVGVSAAEVLTTQLSRRVNRTVANLGQSWYGPQQELELLKRYGLKLFPQVCVWVFFEGNDLADLRRYKLATQDWEFFSKDFHSFRQRSFMKNAVLALRRFGDSIKVRSETVEDTKDQSGLFKTSSGEPIHLYFWLKGHNLSSSDYSALKELRAIVGEAYNLCHSHGANFLMVFAPTKFRVYKDFTVFDTDAEARYWVLNDLPREIGVFVREDLPGAGYLDLTTALKEAVMQGPLLYYDSDIHWSPRGHKVAAAAIAHYIMRWGLYDDLGKEMEGH